MSSPMYDMPEHFPLGVSKSGHGPLLPGDEHYFKDVCWCGADEWPCPKNTDPMDHIQQTLYRVEQAELRLQEQERTGTTWLDQIAAKAKARIEARKKIDGAGLC